MVALFLAPGFEEVEALTPADVLRRAGVEVRLVGVGGREIAGAHGIAVVCDWEARQLDCRDLAMVVLPGGMPGAANLEQSEQVQRCLDYAAGEDLWIAAICAAPYVLGKKGLLRGRRATCFPGYEDQLEGAVYTGQPVEVDGRFITARGAGVALDFALALVSALKGPGEAASIRAAMQARD